MTIRTSVRSGAFLVLGFIGLWLFFDASTFAFYAPDPVTGRGAGCWSGFDLVFGASEPGQLRGIELLTAIALLLVPLVALGRAVGARLSNKRLKLTAHAS